MTVAQKVNIVIIDDINGEEGAETISFGLGNQSYEIDLNPENTAALREVLRPYIEAGRKKVSSTRRKGATSSAVPTLSGKRSESDEIRKWAIGKGYTVAGRGRIPAHIKSAYAAEKQQLAQHG